MKQAPEAADAAPLANARAPDFPYGIRCATNLLLDRSLLHRHLSVLIRELIFSGNQGNLFAGHGEAILQIVAQREGASLIGPLGALVRLPANLWSLEDALALVNSVEGDYLTRLAVLELVSRDLGRQWTTDSCSFAEVSIAMARLQSMLRSREFQPNNPALSLGARGTALFTVPPREDHLFAPIVIEELFRSQGWSTTSYFPDLDTELSGIADKNDFHVVCFSWSGEANKANAFAAVERLRQLFPAPQCLLLAGGHAASKNQSELTLRGVDFVCANGYVGLAVAERHMAERVANKAS